MNPKVTEAAIIQTSGQKSSENTGVHPPLTGYKGVSGLSKGMAASPFQFSPGSQRPAWAGPPAFSPGLWNDIPSCNFHLQGTRQARKRGKDWELGRRFCFLKTEFAVPIHPPTFPGLIFFFFFKIFGTLRTLNLLHKRATPTAGKNLQR